MRKLAIVAFSFSVAVFAANGPVRETVLVPVGALFAGLAVFCCFVMRGMVRRRMAVVLALWGLSAGFVWTAAYTALFFRPVQTLDDKTVLLQGMVEEYPQQTDYGYSVLVRGSAEDVTGVRAVIYTDEQGAELRPGDHITAVTHCTLANHTFSGEEITYYTAKGIFLLGQTYGALDIDRPQLPAVRVWPALLANYLKRGIEHSFSPDTVGLVQALVTGNRDNLSDSFTSSLQRTGLSHMVVVSGMHLSVLAEMLSWILGKGKRSTAGVTSVWVVLFAGVAGNTPSVTRAAVMILMLQVAPLLRRERDGPTSLGVALMFLLIWNPFSAAHVGLQLSFASVAGIELFSERTGRSMMALFGLEHGRKQRRIAAGVLRACISAVATTLGAMVFTIPLVAVHFGYLSVIAPLSNLLVIDTVSLVFFGGFLLGLLGGALPALGHLLAFPFVWLARYVNWVIELLGGLALSSVPLDSFYYKAWLILSYLLLAAGLIMRGSKRVVIPGCACISAFCVSLLLTAASFQTGELTVVVLDVGQGQSVLIRSGDFLTMVDCGGDGTDNAGDVAADYIQALGRSRLDLLILSHYHTDHANGVSQLLERVEVSAIALPDVEEGDGLREEILTLAARDGIPVRFIHTDTIYQLENGNTFTLYAPLGEGTDTNELGLTLVATAGNFDVLVTGDMSGEVEELLLSHACLQDIELLVAGHHGSGTSTTQTFLEAVRPEIAVISAGENNRYGHPAPETLERLAHVGAEIYRTDLQGTVTIQASGREVA